MNTTVEMIQDYVKKEYSIDFKLGYIGTHRYLKYINKKEEYEFMCDYAWQGKGAKRKHVWSIYHDYMNYKEWHGFGGAYEDNGIETIDRIMKEWGFEKKLEQLTLF